MMDNALKYAKECRNKMKDKHKNDVVDTNKKITDIVNRSKMEKIQKISASIIQSHNNKKINLKSLKERVSIMQDKTKQFIAIKVLDKFDESEDLKKRFKNRRKFLSTLNSQVS